jgi:hypothetical protein
VSARENRDRFKNGAHHAGLQDNERRAMRPGGETVHPRATLGYVHSRSPIPQ